MTSQRTSGYCSGESYVAMVSDSGFGFFIRDWLYLDVTVFDPQHVSQFLHAMHLLQRSKERMYKSVALADCT